MTERYGTISTPLTRIPEAAMDKTRDGSTHTAFMNHDVGNSGDAGNDPNALTPSRSEVSTVADSEPEDAEPHAYVGEIAELPRVNILEDPGIWAVWTRAATAIAMALVGPATSNRSSARRS